MSKATRKERGRMMGFLDNLEAYIDFEEEIDKDPELEDING
jgi:hypothetical protein